MQHESFQLTPLLNGLFLNEFKKLDLHSKYGGVQIGESVLYILTFVAYRLGSLLCTKKRLVILIDWCHFDFVQLININSTLQEHSWLPFRNSGTIGWVFH